MVSLIFKSWQRRMKNCREVQFCPAKDKMSFQKLKFKWWIFHVNTLLFHLIVQSLLRRKSVRPCWKGGVKIGRLVLQALPGAGNVFRWWVTDMRGLAAGCAEFRVFVWVPRFAQPICRSKAPFLFHESSPTPALSFFMQPVDAFHRGSSDFTGGAGESRRSGCAPTLLPTCPLGALCAAPAGHSLLCCPQKEAEMTLLLLLLQTSCIIACTQAHVCCAF